MAAFVFITPTAPPKPNGFDLYAASARAIVPANPPVDRVNDPNGPNLSPAQRRARYSPARRAAWIGANGTTWALFNQARAAKSRHPNTRANILAAPPYGVMRELARCKTIEATHFKGLKQWNRALDGGLDIMEMGHDIEHGAPVIGSLVGIAIGAIGAASVQDVPPHLSATEARLGARRLELLIQNSETPAHVLREEKWVMLTHINQNFGVKPGAFGGPASALFKGQTARSTAALMDDFARESSKPFASQIAPPKPSSSWNPFANYVALIYDIPLRYSFNVARRSATSEQLLLRLALRAYRLEQGAYPANLSQLAPKYLAQIPRDPFGRGEAWRYRKTGKSYLAWSIGPDKLDDKGVSIQPKKPGARLYISDDSVGDWVAKP